MKTNPEQSDSAHINFVFLLRNTHFRLAKSLFCKFQMLVYIHAKISCFNFTFLEILYCFLMDNFKAANGMAKSVIMAEFEVEVSDLKASSTYICYRL